MEEDHKSKHTCKFCYKIFPCGRSLGGHMRSHLINISSTEKKLPPLTNAKHDGRIDLLVEDGGQFGYGLRENPKKTRKISDKTEVNDKLCKECGKTFHSWKALFGHMKCHSVIGKGVEEEDSWNISTDHHKPISDNLSSDNEAALCRKKRSDRPKRYTNTANSLSSLTEIDQQEQEEVALSLILLSMDNMSSVSESYNTSSAKISCSDTKSSSAECLKFKFLNEGKLEAEFRAPRKRLKSNEKFEIGCSESEVNSPKTLIKKNGSMNPFGSSDHNKKKNKSSKNKCIDSNDSDFNYKFTCIICRKGFPSYQALGGHRASHKKFKGCCAPTSENSSHETDNSPNLSGNLAEEKIKARVECKKSKDHECPICFKVFPSGQALGGHKRSHMISDQAKNTDPSVSTERRIPEIRGFLDLNLPAPVEEDCNEFKPWWIGTSHKHHHEPLLGLLSS